MSLKALKTIQPKEYELDQIQRNISEFVNQLTVNPLLGGQLLSNITITTGNNNINHGLGRDITGWIITDINTNVNIYKAATQPSPSKILTLTSTGNSTISLYVF